jgi:uncharacterized protein involved in exopolysaccharide biosynthesis
MGFLPSAMSKLDDLAERVERLVLRHQELKRTNLLLEQQVAALETERNSLRSRLSAARARIDVLLERLPADKTANGVAE